MSDAYDELAVTILEVTDRQVRNAAPVIERYKVRSKSPLVLDGIDSDVRLDDGDDDVEVYGDPDGFEIGDLVPVIHENGAYVVQAPGGGSGSGGGGAPTGPAGGDLSGTYPNPQIAANVITDADVNPLNRDGLPAVPSMRTLGTGPNQAAAGNDIRFTDARAPIGAAGGDLSGSYPNPTVAKSTGPFVVGTDLTITGKVNGAVSADPGNRLTVGADGKLYVGPPTPSRAFPFFMGGWDG